MTYARDATGPFYHGTRAQLAVGDLLSAGFASNFADRKLIEPPFLIQGVIGILGGIGADVRNLAHMVTMADSLFGDDYMLSAFAAGRHQMDLCTQSVLLGGHARVGLEDSLFIGKGELASSNAQQVARIRQIVDDARRRLAEGGPGTILFVDEIHRLNKAQQDSLLGSRVNASAARWMASPMVRYGSQSSAMSWTVRRASMA